MKFEYEDSYQNRHTISVCALSSKKHYAYSKEFEGEGDTQKAAIKDLIKQLEEDAAKYIV